VYFVVTAADDAKHTTDRRTVSVSCRADALIVIDTQLIFLVGGVDQWLGRRTLAGGLSLIYA